MRNAQALGLNLLIERTLTLFSHCDRDYLGSAGFAIGVRA